MLISQRYSEITAFFALLSRKIFVYKTIDIFEILTHKKYLFHNSVVKLTLVLRYYQEFGIHFEMVGT